MDLVTTPRTVQPLWMTSREHPGWDTPRRVRVEDTGSGPDPASTYALLRVESAEPQDGALHLVVTDRLGTRWVGPEPGRPREVAVWRLDPIGTQWTDHAFAPMAAAPDASTPDASTPDASSPDASSPDAWCTLCATADEADEIARRTRRATHDAGW